jgi:hypothetical protein
MDSLDSDMLDASSNDIEIVLKPIGIAEIQKKEIKITVSASTRVKEFIKNLISAEGLKGIME